jgi:uncharacterized protein YbjT (DUF2867 family)
MITPKWVQISAQPIAIEDLIEYLEEALFLPDSGSRVYEIGGADQLPYIRMISAYDT